jgi:hypothetical protein
VNVRAGFYVNGDNIGPGIGELLYLILRGLNHQMDIEGQSGIGTESRHYRRPDGYIGDKTPVHHIDVNIVSPCPVSFGYLLTETGEIGGENGRGDFNFWHSIHFNLKTLDNLLDE